jgi:hypothetical protein
MAAGMGELLQKCRERFGSAPRELREEERDYFRLRPSLLMRLLFLVTWDKLRTVLRDQGCLRDHGRVVWGHLVQANEALFNPGSAQVLPAQVIYSPDKYFDDQVQLLQAIAQGLFDLKGTRPKNPELKRFAAAITNEVTRIMRLAIPRALCEDRKVFLTTCLIEPLHLPGAYLASGLFPLVICPEKPRP